MPITDWPIGSPDERATAIDRLPGSWIDSNPFMNRYQIGGAGAYTLHTGADLNLNYPAWNTDWHQPIYAMSWGCVAYQGSGGGSWGHILVVWHWDYLDQKPFYCRIGHLENPCVTTGDIVSPGQIMAYVGNGDGYYGSTGAHCHWDICTTDLLQQKPNEWPGMNAALLLANYTAPIPFVIKRKQQMVTNPDTVTAYHAYLDQLPDDAPVTVLPGVPDPRDPTKEVTAFTLTAADVRQSKNPDPKPLPGVEMVTTANLNVRMAPVTGTVVATLLRGDSVRVVNSTTQGWAQIVYGVYSGKYVSSAYLSPK